MNISQPVASCIGSVSFGLLSSTDVKEISVKKIQNPTTFDSLLHPVPGGLYDAALGAWSDNACATCHLNVYSCPGHTGHIELPVPVYHVSFMSQLLLLLRAKCVYCSHLKLHRAEIHRFVCKLRLVEHGLVGEVEELENIQLLAKVPSINGINGADCSGDEATDSDIDSDDGQDITRKREAFVVRAIERQASGRHWHSLAKEKIEHVDEVRRQIIKEFLTASTKPKTCASCKGVSPGWRKDKFSKIFRKPLLKKDKAKMTQGGFREVNPLIRAADERKAILKQKREEREIDEGIVVDSEDLISEDSGEDLSMLDIGTERTVSRPDSSKSKAAKVEAAEAHQYVNSQEIYAALSELFEKENIILSYIYGNRASRKTRSVTADMFFLWHVLVPPNKYRPEARTGDGEITEAPENTQYKEILNASEKLNQIRKEMLGEAESKYRERGLRDLQVAWVGLQDAVNSLFDSDRNPASGAAAKRKVDGVKQRLEKKEGLFRMNMMGKRVNFAARSVISPDPNIETNEVGVPPVFARKLTYPEPVTNYNFYELKQAVLNGVEKWPGAAAVENESGQVINLRTKNYEERQALANQLLAPSSTAVNGAKNKKVHRHLTNGDIVLMNRQPTLHKPSIMAHRARVLPGEKTIRMHYANCNSYNADFDGDEMNMHFPQNEVARSEALSIADTDHQYLVATSGKPLRGLIQDHISMGVWLTNRDTFFGREDYCQLLCACLRPEKGQTTTNRIEMVDPAVIKPRPLWTGKQVITSVLKNVIPETHPGLNLEGKSQTPGDRWGSDSSEESTVIFKDGDLLCGILDKAHLGPTGKGFIHSVYEAYGHTTAGRVLSIIGRLLTKFLHMRAFTCGMDDLRLTESGNQARREKLKEADTIGLDVATKYVSLDSKSNPIEVAKRLEDVLRDDGKQAGLDSVLNSRSNQLSSEITKACLPHGLGKAFPWNQMQSMTISGAKGSNVNANLISCNLGQQVLEGRRVPVMVSGKTLPSFKPFETNVRAGGYITQRFLTGLKPQESYFHAMAGREGLIDTAVKTSRSGYLQRCLIKGMEGLKSEYDYSVRDSDGSMIQFLYGEDGLDVTKTKHLMDFRYLAQNSLSIFAELNVREEFNKLEDKGAKEYNKTAMKRYKKTGRLDCMDPALALYNPGSSVGCTSERFATALKDYCDANPDALLRDKEKQIQSDISKKGFHALLDVKYLKSIIEPGEAVGVVAGQSIGEPSTQMTLNTFHLAGHSAKNVTLGIPRLREIVMTASRNISTPLMTLHLIPELGDQAGELFAKAISKLSIAEVVDEVHIKEKIGKGVGYERAKIYDIRLELFPSAEYCETYGINVADVVHAIETQFIPQLARAIKKELARKGDLKLFKESAAQPDVGKSVRKTAAPSAEENMDLEGGEDDLDDDGDDDATNNKQKQNQQEATTYEEPDDEEEAIAKEAQRATTPEEPEDEGIGASPAADAEDVMSSKSQSDDEDDSNRNTARARESRIKEKTPAVTRFEFDAKEAQWCNIQLEYDVGTAKLLLLPLVEAVCHSAIIQAIPRLGTCTYDPPDATKQRFSPVVSTQGVNLRAMHEYQDILNPHKIFTNDIAAMLGVYGVEAARATIIREMDSVFKGHSISVDMRHLNLIADVMTRGGGFIPFNRMGLRSAVSPFMKMSFETTMGFVRDAVLEGDWDDLKNPSARIVVGKVGNIGTGAFDVLVPVQQ